MVYPRRRAVFQNMAQPRAPPGEAVAAHLLPFIERVAPALPRFAEIVRRHSRDAARPAVRFEVEKFARGPDVRAVPRDIYRRVAHKLDAELRAAGRKRAELAEEYKLRKFYERKLIRVRRLETRERRLVVRCELRGPIRPAAFAVFLFQQGIERVIAEPVFFAGFEFVKVIRHLRTGAAAKTLPGKRDEPRANFRRGLEISGAPRRDCGPFYFIARQKSVLKEQFRADERRVSGESRRAAVRRVAEDVKHRRKREKLPQGESGLFEEFRELPRASSEIARAVRAGQ